MRYVIDIDGTICSQTDGDYLQAEPYYQRIEKINSLHAEGHEIIFFTARGMGRSKNEVALAYQYCFDITACQLKKWNVKYHKLILGKPAADIYLDDRSVQLDKFFND